MEDTTNTRTSALFDWSMHNFRGVAILFLLVEHYIQVVEGEIPFFFLLQGTTAFFLFISGYLAQYLAVKKPQSSWSYYKKKALNIFLPAFIFTFLYACIVIFPTYRLETTCLWTQVPLDLLKTYCGQHSRAVGPYWYLIYIFPIFIATPALSRMRNVTFNGYLLVAAFAALLLPERGYLFPPYFNNIIYLYAYFTIYYLFGMAYFRYRETIDVFAKRYFGLILGMCIVLAVTITHTNFLGLSYILQSFQVSLLKLLIIFILVVLLNRFNHKLFALDLLAKYSFTLYLIHMFLFWSIARTISPLPIYYRIGLCIFSIASLLFIIKVLKLITGRFSRMIIGS